MKIEDIKDAVSYLTKEDIKKLKDFRCDVIHATNWRALDTATDEINKLLLKGKFKKEILDSIKKNNTSL